ncbi:MAG: magnesium-translocating P-type ATPase [Clostridiaceae bacterium]
MIKPDAIKYWSLPVPAVVENYKTSVDGLSQAESQTRRQEFGENTIRTRENIGPMLLFLEQFKNPIIIILIGATAISAATGDLLDSLIILAIVLVSSVLSFIQEYSASNAIEELRSKVQIKSVVLRDGKEVEIPATGIVPGDVVKLSTGSLIPADGLILESDDFYVNQSILTGEAFPVEKKTEAVLPDASLAQRSNCVYMGTNVSGGSAKVLITTTGISTQFGQIAKNLTLRPPETEFERGVRHFGYLLTQIMLILTLIVFAINVFYQKPAIDSLLFSVALAVGITPQLLPAIINIVLAKGSRAMGKEGVIVRRLNAIENFGSMDVLCTDKTGTLTEGVVKLDNAVNVNGEASDEVFRLAYLNAKLQTGLINPLNQAILGFKEIDLVNVTKLGENSYDFTRKRIGLIAQQDQEAILIVSGALSGILEISNQIEIDQKVSPMDDAQLKKINDRFSAWSNQGFRVLGVAEKTLPLKMQDEYSVADEQGMTFKGFLLFFDPPKEDVIQTIAELQRLGIELRIITGDNKLVAMHIANAVGLKVDHALTGAELFKLSDESLWNVIESTNLFAEVDPNQKERIILALKKKNHVVGYMGDGINDASALHAADVGISVNTAVDVAKESADFVLMEKNLTVLKRGVELGRTTFANTLKYIYITTSANFGNMFSMAGASLFMPFLPLLPKQILLTNFISDFPAMTIASDWVDPEMLDKPRRWDIKSIQNFMIVFGLISSVFDYLAFAVLLIGFKADETLFQSSWFILSIITELMVLLVMRTQKPFFKSKPAPLLLYSTIGAGVITLILPYLPLKGILNIEPISLNLLLSLLGVAALYMVATEIGKYYFYRPKAKKLNGTDLTKDRKYHPG